MAIVRKSTAKYTYECAWCSGIIYKRTGYYRLEPDPWARHFGGEQVQHICRACIETEVPEERTQGHSGPEQPLALDIGAELTIVPTKVQVVDITNLPIWRPRRGFHGPGPAMHESLAETPELLESRLCSILDAMGYGSHRVGEINRKDGGVDIIAWPKDSAIPHLVAVQVKHHRSPSTKTGPGPVRELLGVVQSRQFNVGLLVTNTTFTPDAIWLAEQHKVLIRLKDINDLKRWIAGNFLDEERFREFPTEITLCPGVTIPIASLISEGER